MEYHFPKDIPEPDREFQPLPPEEAPRAGEWTAPGSEYTPPLPEYVENAPSEEPEKKRSGGKWYAAAMALLLAWAFRAQTVQPSKAEPTEPSAVTTAATVAPADPTEPTTTEPTLPPSLGTVQLTVNGSYIDGTQEAILLDSTFPEGTFADQTLPQPEARPGFEFLGYVLTLRSQPYRLYGDRFPEADAYLVEKRDGVRHITLWAAWRRTEGEAFLPLHLDANGGSPSADYDAAGPNLSGTNVFLCAFPEPTRPGYRFDGWYTAAGERVERLSASDFYGQADGQTDWTSQIPVTLFAHWTSEEENAGTKKDY